MWRLIVLVGLLRDCPFGSPDISGAEQPRTTSNGKLGDYFMSTLTFTASSSLAQNVGAHVSVIVDGQKVGSTSSTYSFNANTALDTAHDAQIVNDNDTVVNGQYRNLIPKLISVDRKNFAATGSNEVYHSQDMGSLAGNDNIYLSGTAEFSRLAAESVSPTLPSRSTLPSTKPTAARYRGSIVQRRSAFASINQSAIGLPDHTPYLCIIILPLCRCGSA
jgi:hypothetical protein